VLVLRRLLDLDERNVLKELSSSAVERSNRYTTTTTKLNRIESNRIEPNRL